MPTTTRKQPVAEIRKELKRIESGRDLKYNMLSDLDLAELRGVRSALKWVLGEYSSTFGLPEDRSL